MPRANISLRVPIILLMLCGFLAIPANAQQKSSFVAPASDFCVHFVRTKKATLAPLQKAGFTLKKKRQGHIYGRAEDSFSNVEVFTQGRNRRINCLIEMAPNGYGGNAQGIAVLSLLDWAKKRGHKISELVKGRMTLKVAGDVIIVSLTGGTHRGRQTAYFTFSKSR